MPPGAGWGRQGPAKADFFQEAERNLAGGERNCRGEQLAIASHITQMSPLRKQRGDIKPKRYR